MYFDIERNDPQEILSSFLEEFQTIKSSQSEAIITLTRFSRDHKLTFSSTLPSQRELNVIPQSEEESDDDEIYIPSADSDSDDYDEDEDIVGELPQGYNEPEAIQNQLKKVT